MALKEQARATVLLLDPKNSVLMTVLRIPNENIPEISLCHPFLSPTPTPTPGVFLELILPEM